MLALFRLHVTVSVPLLSQFGGECLFAAPGPPTWSLAVRTAAVHGAAASALAELCWSAAGALDGLLASLLLQSPAIFLSFLEWKSGLGEGDAISACLSVLLARAKARPRPLVPLERVLLPNSSGETQCMRIPYPCTHAPSCPRARRARVPFVSIVSLVSVCLCGRASLLHGAVRSPALGGLAS